MAHGVKVDWIAILSPHPNVINADSFRDLILRYNQEIESKTSNEVYIDMDS